VIGEAWETLSAAHKSEAGAVGNTPVTNRNSIDLLIYYHELLRRRGDWAERQQGAKKLRRQAISPHNLVEAPHQNIGFVRSRALKILLDRETAAFVAHKASCPPTTRD
jgi:hypothetical protein